MLLQHVLLSCLKGTLKGKGRGSVVPTRPFLVAKGTRKEEDDDSEDESPAKPMSSRPSKEIKSDVGGDQAAGRNLCIAVG